MNITFQTHPSFENEVLFNAIEHTINSNVKTLEIFQNRKPSEISEYEINRLIDYKNRFGLTYQYHVTIPLFLSNNPEYIYEVIEFAKLINASVIVVHAYDIRSYIEYGYENIIRDAFSKAKTSNIKIGIENSLREDGSFIFDTVADLINLMKHFKDFDNVGITFDCGHANIQDNSCEYLSNLLIKLNIIDKKIFNVHIHDNLKTRDEHLPPGKGTINFKKIISLLQENNYNGSLTIENWDYAVYSKNYLESILNR